jgi:hypothetical protein
MKKEGKGWRTGGEKRHKRGRRGRTGGKERERLEEKKKEHRIV